MQSLSVQGLGSAGARQISAPCANTTLLRGARRPQSPAAAHVCLAVAPGSSWCLQLPQDRTKRGPYCRGQRATLSAWLRSARQETLPALPAAHLGLSVVLTAFLSFPGRSAFVLPSGRESQYLGSKRKFLGEFLMMPAPHTEALGWLVNVMDSNLELYLHSLLLVEAIYAICSTSQSSTRDLGTDEHDKKTKQTNRQKLRL